MPEPSNTSTATPPAKPAESAIPPAPAAGGNPIADASKAEDALYAQAFDKVTAQAAAGGIPAALAQAEGLTPPEILDEATQAQPAKPAAGAAPPEATGILTAEEVQLLSRNHLDPELVKVMPTATRTAFLTVLAKREADNTKTFRDQKARIEELEAQARSAGAAGANGGTKPNGQESGAAPANGNGGHPAAELAPEDKVVVDNLVKAYGDEIKPFTEMVLRQNQALDNARKDAAEVPALRQLLVEVTMDAAVRSLIGDYPTLSKPEVRKELVQRFNNDWQNSPQRTAAGPMLDRVMTALAESARALFSTTTETAATASLVNKTRERLLQQPLVGAGNSHPPGPKSQDQIYEEAYEKILKPKLARA